MESSETEKSSDSCKTTIEILIGQELIPLTKKLYVIGRDKSCDIQLKDTAVSRRHATIYIREDDQTREIVVTITNGDLITNKPSANGVRINGVLLNPEYGQILNDGDVVELSPNSSFIFFSKKALETDEQQTDLL